jgi:L-glutamine-phosphate cytidylyltransferase
MKVFILAAGVGSRISRLSQGKPKCLLKIEGKTLIDRMVERLNRKGLDDITLITGFKNELIEAELGDRVRYVHNPFYHVTNSIASLWFARDLLEGDILVTNGDLFYEDSLLDVLLEEKHNPFMFSDSTRIEDADYRFRLDGDKIVGYGKDIPVADTDAEYVGMAVIREAFLPKFKERLLAKIHKQEAGDWWEDVLYSFIPEGVPIYHRDIAGIFWAEVDYVEDYDRIMSWVAKNAGNYT